MTFPQEEPGRPLTEAELDAALDSADDDILAFVRDTTDPTTALAAIMAAGEDKPATGVAMADNAPKQGEDPADDEDAPLLTRLEAIRCRMDATLARATVSPASVMRWEERTARHGRQYMTVAPTQLLHEVLADLEEIQQACDQGQPLKLQRGLRRVAAQLAGLTGMLLINLGRHQSAAAFFRTAQAAADETDEPALRAWVMVRRALVSHYYGDPMDGLRLARAAMDLAEEQPCAAQIMASVTEARALARLAQRGSPDVVAAARRALARGRRAFEEAENPEQADPAFGYTRRQMLFHLGEAMAELGQFEEAHDYLTQALALYAPEEQLDRTLIQFDRAFCRASVGDSEEAARLTTQTTQNLPVEYRTNIIRQRASQLESVMRSQAGQEENAPAVRAFRDVIAQL